MIDAQYLEWFNEQFDYADTLTWCTTTSLHDVLAAYDMQAEHAQPGHLDDLYEFRLFAGRLVHGTLVVQPNGCPTREALLALAQHGPCLSVQWSDTAPPGVTYLDKGQVIAFFDPFHREFHPVPDYASVERWIAATPAGQGMWDEDWALATIITAEALFQGAVDEEWVQATHTAVPEDE
ncbi:hypothetical protein GCM10009677_24830 [Sphaerisporangium rubeum]